MTPHFAWVVPNNLSTTPMTAATPYIKLHERKRKWTPVAVQAGQLLNGGEDTIHRALSLRALEIPVGDFISQAMKGDLPTSEGCIELLKSNVTDEENHDIALNYAAEAHKIPSKIEAEAQKITKAWLELDRHPVLKAVVLERSVFFVLLPIFRFLGDTGLRTTSADISRDEQTHVAANTLVCKELGLTPDKTLNNLRKATINWVVQSLDAEASNKHLSANFWQGCSDSLFERGRAEGLSDTRNMRQPAFFECSNNDLPMYA